MKNQSFLIVLNTIILLVEVSGGDLIHISSSLLVSKIKELPGMSQSIISLIVPALVLVENGRGGQGGSGFSGQIRSRMCAVNLQDKQEVLFLMKNSNMVSVCIP
jgi:hypothetical protein